MSAEAALFQRRKLRRNRLIATALLGAMAALFVATALVPQPGFWLLLVRATAEAALVGGLADWFAVTAIFRQPLGLPIPHTAIVPKSKDRIAEGLAMFIENNFLSPELVRAKLRSLDPALRLAEWLVLPRNADRVAARLLRMLPFVLGAIDDREAREFVGRSLGRQLDRIELAPLLGRVVAVLNDKGVLESLLDKSLAPCRHFLETHENQLYAAAEAQRRRWWIPKAVNRQIAKAMISGIKDLLFSLQEPGSPARSNLLRSIEGLAQELATSPEHRVRIEQIKAQLLEDAEVKAWLFAAWGEIKEAILTDLASSRSKIRQEAGGAIHSLGRHLHGDAAMRTRVNRMTEALAAEAVPWRSGLGRFVVEVVRQWDSRSLADRLEALVGRDLQYIRINGTLVGGLVGCLLYLVTSALE